MEEGGAWVAVLQCTGCGEKTYSAMALQRPELVTPCPTCQSGRLMVARVRDRRAGDERRRDLQRVWDPEPRSWRERREQA